MCSSTRGRCSDSFVDSVDKERSTDSAQVGGDITEAGHELLPGDIHPLRRVEGDFAQTRRVES